MISLSLLLFQRFLRFIFLNPLAKFRNIKTSQEHRLSHVFILISTVKDIYF